MANSKARQDSEIEQGRPLPDVNDALLAPADPDQGFDVDDAGRAGAGDTLVIACGALARELIAVIRLNGWRHLAVTCLPAILHNRPERITEAVCRKIRANRERYRRIVCLYGDCGTGGELDRMLAEEGVERIDGAHCYAFYAGIERFDQMMEGAGFEVIDLGINNGVEKYLEAIEKHQPEILGMSALLTTTMPYMKVVIDTLKEKGIRNDFIVLVGGAPLNEGFANAIGADAYCRDAAVAVETAKALMARRQGSAQARAAS